MKLIEETPYRFRIEQEGAMRVPGIVFASRTLLPGEHGDMALVQVANVATLPGIIRAAFAIPTCTGDTGFRSVAWRRRTLMTAVSSPPAESDSTFPAECVCWWTGSWTATDFSHGFVR